MEQLYLWLNIGSIAVPFLCSFHPALAFYKKWRSLFPAILIMMLFFISWDILFTRSEIWGFNSKYFLNSTFLSLPIEEWLFFICIPFACIFTHYSLLHLIPSMSFTKKSTTAIKWLLIGLLTVLVLLFWDRWYTLINFSYAIVLLVLVGHFKSHLLQKYFATFLVMLIPFFIVNGVLTGSGIEQEVVWYNNQENMGIRMGTIPVEDSIYAFTMILTVLVWLEYFEGKFKKEV